MNRRVRIFVSAFEPVSAAQDLESQVNSFLENTPNISVLNIVHQVTSTVSTVLVFFATTNSTN